MNTKFPDRTLHSVRSFFCLRVISLSNRWIISPTKSQSECMFCTWDTVVTTHCYKYRCNVCFASAGRNFMVKSIVFSQMFVLSCKMICIKPFCTILFFSGKVFKRVIQKHEHQCIMRHHLTAHLLGPSLLFVLHA